MERRSENISARKLEEVEQRVKSLTQEANRGRGNGKRSDNVPRKVWSLATGFFGYIFFALRVLGADGKLV